MTEEVRTNPFRLLIVFAKTPEAGQVKTRIGEVVGNEQAAMIYSHMLEIIMAESSSNEIWSQIISIPQDSDKTWFARRGLEVMLQSGNDLGKKMSNALIRGFQSGAGEIILIGSDIPTLCRREIADAFSLLGAAQAVIGPSTDGGFYLFGIKLEHSPAGTLVLEGDIQWSTPKVLGKMQELCRKNLLSLSYLPAKTDIDTYEDWLEYKSAVGED